ncbi:hypothetical protein Tco_1289760 [Tanacetum coccineum]
MHPMWWLSKPNAPFGAMVEVAGLSWGDGGWGEDGGGDSEVVTWLRWPRWWYGLASVGGGGDEGGDEVRRWCR